MLFQRTSYAERRYYFLANHGPSLTVPESSNVTEDHALDCVPSTVPLDVPTPLGEGGAVVL